MQKYYDGMWLRCSGIVGLLGWTILIIWVILYIRLRRQPNFQLIAKNVSTSPNYMRIASVGNVVMS
jgi:hypothetical protein